MIDERHQEVVARYAHAYNVQTEVAIDQPARTNGLAPEDVAAYHVEFGPKLAVLAGERGTSVQIKRRLGEGALDNPIIVRPAYRPEPQPRLSVEHLFPREIDLGNAFGIAFAIAAVLYFVARALPIHAQ